MFFENLKEGTIFSLDGLMKTFKIGVSGGIRKTNTYNCLVIVTDSKNGVYEDTKLENGKFLYTGKGLYGNQELVGENKILCEANIPIYFFEIIEKEKCMYLGKVVVDDLPYQVHELDKNNQDRLVWKFPLRLVSFKNKEEKEFQDIKFKISEMEEKVKLKFPDIFVTYKEGLPNIRKYNFIEHRKEKNEKTNYILNHMKQTILGDENEKRIFEIKYEKVKNAGALKEAEEMKQSFENKKDHEGYDILSFELNENGIYEKKYIEVKSTVGDESVPIDITDNEREFAKDHLKNYYIYRVVKSSSKGAYYKVIKGEDLFNENIYEFKSTSYKIYSK